MPPEGGSLPRQQSPRRLGAFRGANPPPAGFDNDAYEISRASQLETARRNDARSAALRGERRLGDTGPSKENRSPLELPKKSYTSRRRDNVPSRIAEIERQKAEQQKMRETAEEFVGQPIVGGGVQSREYQTPETEAEGRRRQRRRREEREEIAEQDQAVRFADDQARAVAEEERRNQLLSEEQRVAISAALSQKVSLKMKFRMMEAGLASGLVTIPVLILFMNLQVINTFTFKNKSLPPADLKDVLITGIVDLGCITATIFFMLPIILPIIVVVMILT